MKRELKDRSVWGIDHGTEEIARAIPMKRELKAERRLLIAKFNTSDRKGYPDEKGTERAFAGLDVDAQGISQGPSR